MTRRAGLLLVLMALTLNCRAEDAPTPPVKKSHTGICHALGSRYYAQTRHFTAFATLAACLQSGGRLPRTRR
jgi:hypothetical protein